MQDVEDAYRLIAPEMKDMEDLAVQSLRHVDPFIEEVVRYSFRFGGKRLRPAILFLSARAVGRVDRKHVHAATAVEFVHTASLIHDDILDGAAIRRHLATINVHWNAQVGVLAGDVILTKAMELMLRNDDLRAFRYLTEACRKTCEGELRQIGTVGRYEMTEAEYYEMIAGKTAPLLSCSAEQGAYFSGADTDTLDRFRRFGQELGLAFQVIDDILDLVGEDATAGKTLRTDLLNRKPTLPLILLLRELGPEARRETIELLRHDTLDDPVARQLIRRMDESGAVQAARDAAEKHIARAIETIQEITGRSDAVAGLVSIARFIGNRKK